MQQIYLKQLYSNRTSAWVFPWKFAAYFQKTFSQGEKAAGQLLLQGLKYTAVLGK